MAESIPVTWANKTWGIENDVIVQTGLLEPDHKLWIDFHKLGGNSTTHFAASNPTKKYRVQLQEQILSRVLEGLSKSNDGNPSCVLTHGGIASGKTSAIELWLESTSRKYHHIDFDRVKTQIPEYVYMKSQGIQYAAEYVQAESAKLAGRAFKKAIKASSNVIYEGSLANLDAVRERIEEMRKREYSVIVLSTHATILRGKARAQKRYESGGRFVRSEVVSETYEKCPATLKELKKLVDIILLLDNELDDQLVRPILQIEKQKTDIINPALYAQYLQCVGSGNALD